MSSDQIDYTAVLTDLRAKRAALDSAIAALEMMLGQASSVPTGPPGGLGQNGAAIPPSEIPDGAFFNMTIAAASKQYLRMVRRKQTTKQIGDAIKRGGVHSTAKNFTTTVYSVLERQPDFTRVGNEWALIEWYPGLKKQRKPKGASPQDDTDESVGEDEQG